MVFRFNFVIPPPKHQIHMLTYVEVLTLVLPNVVLFGDWVPTELTKLTNPI